ncbi:hypothetical protein FO519_002064 [Halicephalobus sp. NKZ332]|nr:hypothetical protein FO519_002064 [Halicephalobus sp. NKZ332]
MSVMFASNPAGSRGNNGNLLEFRAGQARLEPVGSDPDKRKVVSDKTKGLVYIKQSQDQLMHLYWKNRETNAVEVDLIIFPGDTEFIKVKECADGRMFMLKFKNTSDQRKLFWLQDPPKDKDDELVKKVNDLLNNPPPQRHGRGGASERSANALNALAQLGNGEDIGALGNMDQNQLMQLFSLMQGGGGADLIPQLAINNRSGDKETVADDPNGSGPVPVQIPSTTKGIGDPDRGASSSKKNVRIKPDQLRSILSQVAEGKPGSSSGSSRQPSVELSDVLNKSTVGPSLEANTDRLIPHLPSQDPVKQNKEELQGTLSTPQFRQAVNSFGVALQTGQMGPALKQFKLNDDTIQAAERGNILEFAKKLTEAESPQRRADTGVKKRPCPEIGAPIPEINAQINAEADAEETNESAIKEPSAKKGKPGDDTMDLD